MAVVKNFAMLDQKGKIGGQVYYQVAGETRSRQLAASVSNPRTVSQMEQRTRWANLVNFYRANKSWMKYAYETKKKTQSDYNKFMSLNVANSRIYLPKSIANQGGCIVDAYQMTQGSLSPVEVSRGTNSWLTNIFLPNSSNLDLNSTIGEWSTSLLEGNPAIHEGDQLSFIRFTQLTSASTGVPYVVVRKYEVIVKTSDTRRFYDYMPADYIVPGGTVQSPCIEVEDSGNAGGFLLILSRTVGGKTYVSTQSIVVANNSTMIEQYSSAAAQQTAIDSYGESAEPFLTSTVAERDSQAAVRPSIVTVVLDGTIKPLGQVASVEEIQDGSYIGIQLSTDLGASTVDSIKVRYYSGGQLGVVTLASPTIEGATVTGIFELTNAIADAYLADVVVEIDGEEYRGVWVVPNEATIGGLE